MRTQIPTPPYVEAVKRNLWRRNFRVKDMTQIYKLVPTTCDLVVNGRYRVVVRKMNKTTASFRLEPDHFDVLCIVTPEDRIYYLPKKKFEWLAKGSRVFPVNFATLNYFSKHPQDVFKPVD